MREGLYARGFTIPLHFFCEVFLFEGVYCSWREGGREVSFYYPYWLCPFLFKLKRAVNRPFESNCWEDFSDIPKMEVQINKLVKLLLL